MEDKITLSKEETAIIKAAIAKKVASIIQIFNYQVRRFESEMKGSFQKNLERNYTKGRGGKGCFDEIFNLDMDAINDGIILENLLFSLGETKDNGRSELSKMAVKRAAQKDERFKIWLMSFIAGVSNYDELRGRPDRIQASYLDDLV
ncbi:MAG: hypothetical protein WC564_00260 [Patescibacteria group bacterium]|jgi:hypothetical protein